MSTRNVLVSQARIQTRVSELAQKITHDYQGRQLDIVCLINGGSTFCADLVRQIGVPIRQHYLGFTSYAHAKPTGEVRVLLDVAEPLYERHVLIVEGIVISGRTPRYIVDMLSLRKPASLALCALATKPAALAVELPLAYTAFELGSEIAVGYGVGDVVERALPALVELPK
jgi:hypoxanthine phosphoribosyltransferase